MIFSFSAVCFSWNWPDLVSLFFNWPEKRRAFGFTTDLIHRDSPQSLSYDPTLSPEQRLVNAIRRSLSRAKNLNAKRARLQSPTAELFPVGGEYLVKYTIGTPPVSSLGIVDTGSDVIWNQCQPCIKCFNQSLPVFDPRKSSTYRTIPCGSTHCKALGEPTCSKGNLSCHYSQMYGDGSYTRGDLSTETVTLASSGTRGRRVISVPGVVVGCGYSNAGLFSGTESGILGLGGGEASLIRQLGRLAGGKFSYCMASERSGKSSRLSFGKRAAIMGPGAVGTPFVRQGIDTFYYLTMLGISVESQRLTFYEGEGRPEGNIIIDSGTTMTFLPGNLYAGLKKAMQGAIGLRQVPDPTQTLDLCFNTPGNMTGFPDVTVHFKGADLKLGQENLFARTGDDVMCLVAKQADGVAIYANLAQVNFQVGYDLRKKIVSFRPADCGRPL